MKTIVGIFSLAFAVSFTLPVAALAVQPAATVQLIDDKKEEIKVTDLPAAAQDDLKASFPEATVTKAYRISGDDGTVTGYEVVLDNNGTEKQVSYDANGKRLI